MKNHSLIDELSEDIKLTIHSAYDNIKEVKNVMDKDIMINENGRIVNWVEIIKY